MIVPQFGGRRPLWTLIASDHERQQPNVQLDPMLFDDAVMASMRLRAYGYRQISMKHNWLQDQIDRGVH